MVIFVSTLNWPVACLFIKVVFPTPPSPATSTLKIKVRFLLTFTFVWWISFARANLKTL
jgi:hypothetical protein